MSDKIEKTQKQKYEEELQIQPDEDNFVATMLRLTRIYEKIGEVSMEFYDQDIDGYEALTKVEALLSMMNDIREKIKARL